MYRYKYFNKNIITCSYIYITYFSKKIFLRKIYPNVEKNEKTIMFQKINMK